MFTLNKIFCLLLLPGFLLSCSLENNNTSVKTHTPFISFLYQLQSINIESIFNSGFSLVILDYSKDGSDANKISKAEVQSLIRKKITPIAYLSLGEAETYRYYWEPDWLIEKDSKISSPIAPRWLGQINPKWEGNFKVRYWDTEWKENIIQPYLDKILSQGFRGIYLDIIDAFEYWGNPLIYKKNLEVEMSNDPMGNEEESARRMIALVVWVAKYCRSKSPYGEKFLVIPQNGERIFLYDDEGIYLNAVSGIGVEEIWYNQNESVPSPIVNGKLKFLRQFIKNKKLVLSVDYVDDSNHENKTNIRRIKQYVSKCRSEGFYCYAGRAGAELKVINRIPGIQPQ